MGTRRLDEGLGSKVVLCNQTQSRRQGSEGARPGVGTKRDRSQARGWIWEAESLGHVWRIVEGVQRSSRSGGRGCFGLDSMRLRCLGGPSSEVLRRHLDIQD